MSEQVQERRGREGGRWVNERPSSEDFATWFKDSMRIDKALRHEDYIGGVVLIPAVDSKAKHVTGFRDGVPVIEEREELSYIPYAKVETRIDYFWDLLAAHEEEWIGVVERVTPPRMPIDFVTEEERRVVGLNEEGGPREQTSTFQRRQPTALTALTHQLPEGFSLMTVPVGQNYSHFLCCTTRVSIYRREEWKADRKNAVPVRTGTGTKQVPLLLGRQSVYADSSSLMKCETGSLGRALGFAGIFIIPGSGVATAEDMLEENQSNAPAQAEGSGQGPAAPTQAPARTGAEQAVDDETQLKARAVELYGQLKERFPAKVEEFATFAQQRKLRSLGEAKGATLRGVVKRLEKLIDEGESEEHTDVPAETGESGPDNTGEEAADGDESSGSTG